MNNPVQHRYDFVYLFDVVDGNPNGDPDAGNLPRIDAETAQGLVTDVCLKRKVRNYVGLVHGEKPPHEIYVKERAVLNAQHERAYQKLNLKPEPKKLPKDEAKARELTRWMCQNFYDIRTFGAVMTTKVKPSRRLTLHDRLSRLDFLQACKLLGENGKKLILKGEEHKLPDAIRIGAEEGMQDFTMSLKKLIDEELIDRPTAFAVAPSVEALKMALKGIDVRAPGIL